MILLVLIKVSIQCLSQQRKVNSCQSMWRKRQSALFREERGQKNRNLPVDWFQNNATDIL